MPLLSLCSYPGCRHPVPRGEKYCDKHKGASSCRRRSAGNGASGRKARRRPEAMVLAGGDFASAFFQNTLFARSVWSGGARCPLRTWITSDRIGEMRRSCGMKRTFRPYATPATAGRRPRRMVGLGTNGIKSTDAGQN